MGPQSSIGENFAFIIGKSPMVTRGSLMRSNRAVCGLKWALRDPVLRRVETVKSAFAELGSL
jgi:hypothetical protein